MASSLQINDLQHLVREYCERIYHDWSWGRDRAWGQKNGISQSQFRISMLEDGRYRLRELRKISGVELVGFTGNQTH